jgi:hypothetical protein
MDQIHLSPLVDQIQLTLGHISNTFTVADEMQLRSAEMRVACVRWQ